MTTFHQADHDPSSSSMRHPRRVTRHPSAARVDRRGFLSDSIAIGGAALFGAGSMRSASAGVQDGDKSDAIPITDTHQHLWDLKSQTLPWLKGAPDVLNQTYWLNEYAAATKGLNVTKAIYMEVDIDPKQQVQEADTLIEICRKGGTPTIAAVISGRPDSQQFGSYIQAYRDTAEIKGVRQVLHSANTPRGFCLRPTFVQSMKLLGDLGMSYDLCMRPGELSDGVALARQCPETLFIVDHCGNAEPSAFLKNPPQPPAHDPEQWKRDMRDLASCSNVICKISGIIASAPKGVPFAESLAPVVNECLDQFGPDRVVFGGDWPVCLLGAAFAEWVTALRAIVASRPREAQEKLFFRNAERYYRLRS